MNMIVSMPRASVASRQAVVLQQNMAPRFGVEPEAQPKSKYGKPDPKAAFFVLALLAGFAGSVFFGPAIKEWFSTSKDNCPPKTTQRLNQGDENPVERVK